MPRRARFVLALIALLSAAGCASTTGAGRPLAFPGSAPLPSMTDETSLPSIGFSAARSALEFLGIPYRYGGQDPAAGFDCSGLVWFVFDQHERRLPRTVADQFTAGEKVSEPHLESGDLVFFSTIGPGPTHVGIALGDLNDGAFVHAPDTGGVVRVDRYDAPYWRARFLGARRVR